MTKEEFMHELSADAIDCEYYLHKAHEAIHNSFEGMARRNDITRDDLKILKRKISKHLGDIQSTLIRFEDCAILNEGVCSNERS